MVKISIKKGFSFGLTSGVITTLGLMVGLNSSTHNAGVVIGGILIIAVADALSDAMGVHLSEESDSRRSHREAWEAAISTFLFKFLFALTFVIPVLAFEISTAIYVSVGWGLFLIMLFSYFLAKQKNEKPHKVILEHVILTIFVIFITHNIGEFIAGKFGS